MRLPSTPVTTLQRALRDEVRQHYRAGRIVLAVDGVDTASTTVFADGFAEVFAEQGSAVYRASIEDFSRPRAQRQGGGYDGGALDEATFRRVLLDPFRTGEGAAFQLAVYDENRDMALPVHWVSAPRDAVLIVDGTFLHGAALRGAWNWSVWLETANPTDDRARYLREATPRAAASAIVEHSDPAHPVRVFGDFC